MMLLGRMLLLLLGCSLLFGLLRVLAIQVDTSIELQQHCLVIGSAESFLLSLELSDALPDAADLLLDSLNFL